MEAQVKALETTVRALADTVKQLENTVKKQDDTITTMKCVIRELVHFSQRVQEQIYVPNQSRRCDVITLNPNQSIF